MDLGRRHLCLYLLDSLPSCLFPSPPSIPASPTQPACWPLLPFLARSLFIYIPFLDIPFYLAHIFLLCSAPWVLAFTSVLCPV